MSPPKIGFDTQTLFVECRFYILMAITNMASLKKIKARDFKSLNIKVLIFTFIKPPFISWKETTLTSNVPTNIVSY